MERYLDKELNDLKLTKDSLEKIHHRILKRYAIDLKKELDDKLSWNKIEQTIMGIYDQDRKSNSLEKMRFQKVNEQTLYLTGKREDGSKIIRSDELIGKLSDEEVLVAYNKFMGPVNMEEIHKIHFGMTFDEWKQDMNTAVATYGIFKMDCKMQSLLRLKYTLLSDQKYNYYDGRRKGDFQVTGRLPEDAILPMKDLGHLSVFIKELQDAIFTQKYIRIFDFGAFYKSGVRNPDITRYSFEYVEDIFKKIENCAIENFYYLDYIFGITLTNTIFNHVLAGSSFYEYDKEKMKINPAIFDEDFMDLISLVSKIDGIYGRDLIAQMVFGFLFLSEFKKEEIHKVKNFVEKNVKRYNRSYKDICDAYAWLCFYDINQWTDEDKNNVLLDLENNLIQTVKDNLIDKGISKIMEESESPAQKTKRLKMTGQAKRPAGLYARIHMKVMEGIWKI